MPSTDRWARAAGLTLATVALPWLLTACGGDAPDPCADAPTYTNDVAPITEARCLGCHSAAFTGDRRSGAPAGYDFDDLARIQPNLAAFADAITSGRMPPPSTGVVTTQEERQIVRAWRACDFKP
ncbi:hypothetical protein L6R52_06505 [Myxococcota bacterium]|nr:hypothetical protein [Myxococcota bacterium]